MTLRSLSAIFAITVFSQMSGCGPAKLNKTASFSLGADKPAVGYEGATQSAAQSLKVEVDADSPVHVFVVTGMTLDDAVNTPEGTLKTKAVAQKLDAAKDSLTAPIPAGQKPVVVLMLGAKSSKASGSVKLTN